MATALFAITAHFDTPGADGRFGDTVAVNPEHPRPYGSRHPQGAAYILTPDPAAKTVFRGIAQLNGLFFIVKRNDRQYGAENFLPGNTHIVADPRQHGWLDKITI